LSAWVDLNTPELQVVHWTEGFAMVLRNPHQGVGFLQLLKQDETQSFLTWLHTQATNPSETFRKITLLGRGVDRVRHFTCSVIEVPQELLAQPSWQGSSQQGVRIARLDLQRLSNRKPQAEVALTAALKAALTPRRFRGGDIRLWVEVETKRILQCESAPRSMFQEGSTLTVAEEAHQECAEESNLFMRIKGSVLACEVAEQFWTCDLGTHTLVSGGYQLGAEIKLIDLGEDWEEVQRPWWYLRLSNTRLLGKECSPRTIVLQLEAKQRSQKACEVKFTNLSGEEVLVLECEVGTTVLKLQETVQTHHSTWRVALTMPDGSLLGKDRAESNLAEVFALRAEL